MSDQSDFAAKVQELITQSKDLTLDARNKIMEMLDAVRKEIIARLADIDPASFSAAQLNIVKQQIDSLMKTFANQATAVIDDFQSRAFSLGAQTASSPLQLVGLESSSLGQISESSLKIAQAYTADLVQGLSADAAAKLNGAITRAFLGGQSLTDIISQVGRALSDGQGFTGIFSQIGKRAVDVTTNEVLRVQSIAGQARMEDAAARHADLKKQWHHLSIARVPRPGHVAADGQVVAVSDAFLVEGEELMYPRDPNGSPENTINCHCVSAPYFDADALQPSARRKGLLDSVGISVSAA